MPGTIALVAMLVAWRPWRRQSPIEHAYWGGAVGFSIAYAVAHILIYGRTPGFPPTQAIDWLLWFSLFGGVAGLATSFRRVPRWVGSIGVGLLIVIMAKLMFSALSPTYAPRPLYATLISIAIGLGVASAHVSLDTLAMRVKGGTLPVCLWLTLAGSNVLIALFYNAKSMAELGGSLAAACGAAAVLGFWRPTITIARGAVLVTLLIFAGLCLATYLFGQQPNAWALGLAFASPNAAWIGQAPGIRSLEPWQRALIRIACVGALLGLAIAIGRPEQIDDPYLDY